MTILKKSASMLMVALVAMPSVAAFAEDTQVSAPSEKVQTSVSEKINTQEGTPIEIKEFRKEYPGTQVIIHASPVINQKQENLQDQVADQKNDQKTDQKNDQVAESKSTADADADADAEAKADVDTESLSAAQADALRNAQIGVDNGDKVLLGELESADLQVDRVIVKKSSVAVSVAEPEQKEELRVIVSPVIGVPVMGSTDGYDVHGNFISGLNVGIQVQPDVVLELGYTYGEYGIQMTSTNPFVSYVQQTQNFFNPGLRPLTLKQNVISLGAKGYLFDRDLVVRPFIGMGGAWSKGFINYDQAYKDALAQFGRAHLANDYKVSSFLAYLSLGGEMTISKNISFTGNIRYYRVLTARENQGFNNVALYGFNPYGYNAGFGQVNDQTIIGGSVARSSFLTFTLGVNFAF